MSSPPPLRLLADDLTGALDSAARFVPLTGPVATVWHQPEAIAGAIAFDSGTRDLPVAAVARQIEQCAGLLRDGLPAFKKIDSLLRGHVALELAACMRWFDHCVLAPAFPFQGRVTRGGRQLVRSGDGWRDTGVTLPPDIARWLHDAETDDDLDSIVAQGRALSGRVLWCGTGGLAGALAGRRPVPRPVLPRPILALIGTDHAVSAGQLAAVAPLHRRLPDDDAGAVTQLLAGGGAAVTVALEPGVPRDAACDLITGHFTRLLAAIPRPGTLFVAGGETLRHLCDSLGVTQLEVDGEIEPGVPTSLLRGGAWDGQRVVSKSGAFGATGFLAALLGEQG